MNIDTMILTQCCIVERRREIVKLEESVKRELIHSKRVFEILETSFKRIETIKKALEQFRTLPVYRIEHNQILQSYLKELRNHYITIQRYIE